ncbi:MAG TPA: hypothetical protein VMV05_12495 [bacterium]|nr:hypothetical protein [bacterium]
MKTNTVKVFLGVFLAGALGFPGLSGAGTGDGKSTQKAVVQQNLDELKTDMTQVEKFQRKAAKVRESARIKILGREGRTSAENEMGMYVNHFKSFKSEAWNDIGCLRDDWKWLTPNEKIEVERAEIQLE